MTSHDPAPRRCPGCLHRTGGQASGSRSRHPARRSMSPGRAVRRARRCRPGRLRCC